MGTDGLGVRSGWSPVFDGPKRLSEHRRSDTRPSKIVFRDIAATTNRRTFIYSSPPLSPCGDSILFACSHSGRLGRLLPVILNSFIFDWAPGQRLAGANSAFLVEELASSSSEQVSALASALFEPLLGLTSVSRDAWLAITASLLGPGRQVGP